MNIAIYYAGINETSPPVNCLTLDEIQAREDIQPSTSGLVKSTQSTTGEGMEAFNKLLSVLQSKPDLDNRQVVILLFAIMFKCVSYCSL